MRQPTQFRKAIVLSVVFAAWLGADLWTKDWADRALAGGDHPLPFTVSEAETRALVAFLRALTPDAR